MTEDLVQFLRAQLDEEQRAAEEVLRRTTTTRRRIQGRWVEDTIQPPEWRRSAWPPQRVLAEVDAKRQLLNAYAEVADMDVEDTEPEFAYGRAVGLGLAVRLLALPYADHPDYRDEWRP